MMSKIEAVKKSIEDNYHEQLGLLETIVNCDSSSRNKAGVDVIASILGRELEKIGAEVKFIINEKLGNHVLARIIPVDYKGKLLIIGHMDTVFNPGDTESHQFHIKGPYAYGLGIADMKGGIVTALYAVKTVAQLKMLPKKEIVFIFNSDEEVYSPTSKALIKQEAENAEAVFVFEPSRDNAGIITKRKGVGQFYVRTWGKEAHSGSQFSDGRNAVVELAHKILKLHAMNGLEKGVTVNIGEVHGGKNDCIVPGYAEAIVSVRVPNEKSLLKTEKKIKALVNDIEIEGCRTEISGSFIFPPMERNSKNIALYQKIRKIGKKMGLNLEETHTGGSSDACFASNVGAPTVDGLGPYKYNTHTKDEHIYLPSLKERTILFALTLCSF